MRRKSWKRVWSQREALATELSNQLPGKTAIVTGGGSGIGRAIALGFAAEGVSVAVADIDGKRTQSVAGEIEASGGPAIGLVADISRTEDVDAMVEEVLKRFGRLDILVNNAGRAGRGFVSQMTDEVWDGVVAVNLRGTFVCTRAALFSSYGLDASYDEMFDLNMKGYFWMTREVARHLQGRGAPGSIINVASVAGIEAAPLQGVYGATKAAIINFTRALAVEVAHFGITANAIGPGVTDTPLWRAQRSEADIAEAYEKGRVGQPEDFVPLVVFLCSDAGRIHTGQMFDRDIYLPRE